LTLLINFSWREQKWVLKKKVNCSFFLFKHDLKLVDIINQLSMERAKMGIEKES